ncbi:MAG: hypothetical protein D8M58_08875 [Calditrichaeota bacterium]|nr:MAG: hypothetical protein DWQ03_17615 [Calditrichota bacterium]MBL1205497.1 hypothetical protein [Calditrichota bacterium]NOG45325.1 hypothetical protein [Calditrichota bacterium]
MMTCDKAKALLSDYIDETLEPGVKKEIDEFLERDPECKNIFMESLSISEKIKNLQSVLPSEDFDSNLRNEIIKINNEEKTPALNKKGLSLIFSGTVLAASIYFFIFTDIGVQQNIQEGSMPSSAIGNPAASFQDEKNAEDKFVEAKEDETKSDSLKNVPEKVNSENIHLTGDK